MRKTSRWLQAVLRTTPELPDRALTLPAPAMPATPGVPARLLRASVILHRLFHLPGTPFPAPPSSGSCIPQTQLSKTKCHRYHGVPLTPHRHPQANNTKRVTRVRSSWKAAASERVAWYQHFGGTSSSVCRSQCCDDMPTPSGNIRHAGSPKAPAVALVAALFLVAPDCLCPERPSPGGGLRKQGRPHHGLHHGLYRGARGHAQQSRT